jgi:RNA polymerase sigma factor (TIGR02999 family)
MNDVTRIPSQIEQGAPSAAEQLMPLVYDELRRLAAAKLACENPGQTLQATALVHEAYLRLLGPEKRPLNWNSRAHFFAAAAEAMRRILVEMARRKRGPKAGGRHQRVEFTDVVAIKDSKVDIIALSDSLDRLQARDSRAAELVKLRFFAGLTRQQAAEILGVSVATLDNDWAYAKGWLKAELSDHHEND